MIQNGLFWLFPTFPIFSYQSGPKQFRMSNFGFFLQLFQYFPTEVVQNNSEWAILAILQLFQYFPTKVIQIDSEWPVLPILQLFRWQRLMYSTRVCSLVNLRGGWVGRGGNPPTYLPTPPPTHLPPPTPHPPTPPPHPPTYPYPPLPPPPTHPPTTCIIIN